jgi:maltose O-acetyltransferase
MSLLSYHLRRIVANTVAGAFFLPKRFRRSLYRACGIPVGDNTEIFSGALLRSLDVVIGNNSFINYRCLFEGTQYTTIGNGVMIDAGVSFLTTSYEVLSEGEKRTGSPISAPIFVEDGAWIGANATILPGVTIGRGSIVEAGAVVTGDVEPNTVYQGVPATKTRDLTPLSGAASPART